MGLFGAKSVPRAATAQAECLAAQARLSADFFKSPSEAKAIVARDARAKFARHSKAPLTGDWRTVSSRLIDASDHIAWAVDETLNFSLEKSALLGSMGASLMHAAAALSRAVSGFKSKACEGRLGEVRSRALETEETHRKARAKALNDPNVVSGLKVRGVIKRLSEAAEALQRSADELAGMLAASGD